MARQFAGYEMTSYTTDFGDVVPNLDVKIKEGFEDFIKAVPGTNYSARLTKIKCSESGLFTPRALIATFGGATATTGGYTGARIRFPLATRDKALISAAVDALKQKGAVCVDLDGEDWRLVSYNKFGGVRPNYLNPPLFSLANSGKVTKKLTGRYAYNSDVSANANSPFLLKLNMEYDPQTFVDALVGDDTKCVGKLSAYDICIDTAIEPRRAVVQGIGVPANAATATGNKVIRSIPIVKSSAADIKACLLTISQQPGVLCISYHGESIPRVDLLVGQGSNEEALGSGRPALVHVG